MAEKNCPEDTAKIEAAIFGAALASLGLAAECKALAKSLLLAQRFNTMAAIMLRRTSAGDCRTGGDARHVAAGARSGVTDRSPAGKSMAAFLARLGTLVRQDIRLLKFEKGRRGDRVAITALLSLILGARAPITKPAEWCLALPEIVTGGNLERLDELDARPSGWTALTGEMARVSGIVERKAA